MNCIKVNSSRKAGALWTNTYTMKINFLGNRLESKLWITFKEGDISIGKNVFLSLKSEFSCIPCRLHGTSS